MTNKLWILSSLLCFVLSTWAIDYNTCYKDLPTQVKAVEAFAIPQNEINLKDVGGIGDGITHQTNVYILRRMTKSDAFILVSVPPNRKTSLSQGKAL